MLQGPWLRAAGNPWLFLEEMSAQNGRAACIFCSTLTCVCECISGFGSKLLPGRWHRRPSTRCRSSLRRWGTEGTNQSSRTMPSTIAVPHPFGLGTNSFGRMLIAICSPGLLPRRSRTAWRCAFRRSAALRSTTLRRKSDEDASDATVRTASNQPYSATAGSATASIHHEMPSSNTRRTSPCCHPSSRLRYCCS